MKIEIELTEREAFEAEWFSDLNYYPGKTTV